MTGRPADPRAVRFDLLVTRLVAAEVAHTGIANTDDPKTAAWACDLAREVLGALRYYDPITGEPTDYFVPPHDEDQQP